MRRTTTINLRRLLQAPNVGDIHKVVVREPTFDEYFAIGDPYNIAYTPTGTGFAVENPDNIRRYIDMCVVEPQDPAILRQGDALLAREVKKAVLDFFLSPDEADSASATSETGSPSLETGQGSTVSAG